MSKFVNFTRENRVNRDILANNWEWKMSEYSKFHRKCNFRVNSQKNLPQPIFYTRATYDKFHVSYHFKLIEQTLPKAQWTQIGGFCQSDCLKQNRWIFGKVPRREGGGVIFNPKNVADFGPLNRAFWAWNWYTICNLHDFPKMRGVGAKAVSNFSENSSALVWPFGP